MFSKKKFRSFAGARLQRAKIWYNQKKVWDTNRVGRDIFLVVFLLSHLWDKTLFAECGATSCTRTDVPGDTILYRCSCTVALTSQRRMAYSCRGGHRDSRGHGCYGSALNSVLSGVATVRGGVVFTDVDLVLRDGRVL